MSRSKCLRHEGSAPNTRLSEEPKTEQSLLNDAKLSGFDGERLESFRKGLASKLDAAAANRDTTVADRVGAGALKSDELKDERSALDRGYDMAKKIAVGSAASLGGGAVAGVVGTAVAIPALQIAAIPLLSVGALGLVAAGGKALWNYSKEHDAIASAGRDPRFAALRQAEEAQWDSGRIPERLIRKQYADEADSAARKAKTSSTTSTVAYGYAAYQAVNGNNSKAVAGLATGLVAGQMEASDRRDGLRKLESIPSRLREFRSSDEPEQTAQAAPAIPAKPAG